MTLNKFLDPAIKAKKSKSLEELTLLFQDELLFQYLKIETETLKHIYKDSSLLGTAPTSVFYYYHADFFAILTSDFCTALSCYSVEYDARVHIVPTKEGVYFYIFRNQDLI